MTGSARHHRCGRDRTVVGSCSSEYGHDFKVVKRHDGQRAATELLVEMAQRGWPRRCARRPPPRGWRGRVRRLRDDTTVADIERSPSMWSQVMAQQFRLGTDKGGVKRARREWAVHDGGPRQTRPNCLRPGGSGACYLAKDSGKSQLATGTSRTPDNALRERLRTGATPSTRPVTGRGVHAVLPADVATDTLERRVGFEALVRGSTRTRAWVSRGSSSTVAEETGIHPADRSLGFWSRRCTASPSGSGWYRRTGCHVT